MKLTLTLHHLPDGTFAAEVPTITGEPNIVFSKPFDSDSNRIDQYSVLAAALLRMFGLVLPPLSETHLTEPGEETVAAKFAS